VIWQGCSSEVTPDVTTNLLPHLLQLPRSHQLVCKSPSLPPTFDVSALPPQAFKYDDGMQTLYVSASFIHKKYRRTDENNRQNIRSS